MSRYKSERIPPKEKQQLLHALWTAVALLENVGSIKNFFKDLLSETESVMLARRLLIARLICRGISYDEIEKKLHTSPNTIATVHAWLDGGFGGYREVVERLEDELYRQRVALERKEEAKDPSSFAYIRKKYPMHFLLQNIAEEGNQKPVPRKLRRKSH